MIADALSERWELSKPKDRFRGRLAEGALPGSGAGRSLRGARVAVLWPQTYMNDAGRSVGPAMGSFKLDPERVIVIHDEIDLPFGEVRTRLGGGLAGHNGLKSVKGALGSPRFWRVRVGVGRPDSSDPEIVSSWVLGRFEERPGDVERLVQDGADAARGLAQTAPVQGLLDREA
jgi:peptidyl-tRNA hydrolase, PTH1 family